ncbi:hypothetical protein SAY87_010559 [Trapa incisa]|uniref:Uncharacterized protein n=1 Tax=Trapa incisa TaxID=236973 RepID=A0AAN7JI37_9MYRT|nr:hypothetical protein SAY87_010559 [Trapa incisa]
MDSYSRKSNKISDIVRLQQMFKKWKKLAKNGGSNSSGGGNSITATNAVAGNGNGNGTSTTSKSIKFLKRTLSFTDVSAAASDDAVPKGFLAVCVGRELKRFVIPTEYLRHQAFGVLLQEAEEEFGFQQEGVLKIPCEVALFERILKAVENKRDVFLVHGYDDNKDGVGYCSASDCELTPSHHPQLCR